MWHSFILRKQARGCLFPFFKVSVFRKKKQKGEALLLFILSTNKKLTLRIMSYPNQPNRIEPNILVFGSVEVWKLIRF